MPIKTVLSLKANGYVLEVAFNDNEFIFLINGRKIESSFLRSEMEKSLYYEYDKMIRG